MHRCIENNITSFLLGRNFAREKSRFIGNAFSESGLSRDKVQLIGNLGKVRDSRKDILSGVDNLLYSCRLDYLDLLLLDAEPGAKEVLSTLDELQSRGTIRETGSLSPGFYRTLREHSFTNTANLRKVFIAGRAEGITKNSVPHPEDGTSFISLEFSREIQQQNMLETLQRIYDMSLNDLIRTWLLSHPAQYHLLFNPENEHEVDRGRKAIKAKLAPKHLEIISNTFRLNTIES